MKKGFLFSLIIILSIIFADIIVGSISRMLLEGLPSSGTLFSNNKYALLDSKTDILIIGSSRANHHYDPIVFTDSLNLTCYNGGIDGHGMPMAYSVYKSVTDKQKPIAIILDNWKTIWSDKHMDDLRYLYELNPHVRHIIDINISNSFVEKLKYKSNLYLYNNTLPRILQSYLIGNTNTNGYIPSPAINNNKLIAHVDSVDLQYDSLCLSLLEDMIKDCKERNIKLIFVVSPTLEIQKNEFMEKTDSICRKYGIIYFNYNEDPRFTKDITLFNDEIHMNEIGADLFSKDLASKLKLVLSNK